MAVFDQAFKDSITDLIIELGDSLDVTIAHLDGNQSRGKIVFSSANTTDVSIPDVGTVQGADKVAFITDVRNPICVGDSVTANSITYRVRESKEFKPATINIAWRVLLDT